MFGGIYYGAMYGGSTTSILLNTPGETASIVTAIDGHMMARQGRGAAALTTAAIGSFVAGTLATLALTFFAPPLASVALRFGPAEYFALTVARVHDRGGAARRVDRCAGCSACSSVWRSGLIGIDQLTGDARFSFGIPQLLDGIDVDHPRDRPVRRRRDDLSRRGGTAATRWTSVTLHDFTGHEPRGLEAIVEALAARHGDRLSARRAAVRRLGDPDVPLLHGREAAERDARASSATARSKAWPAPRRPTTPRPPACWCRC